MLQQFLLAAATPGKVIWWLNFSGNSPGFILEFHHCPSWLIARNVPEIKCTISVQQFNNGQFWHFNFNWVSYVKLLIWLSLFTSVFLWKEKKSILDLREDVQQGGHFRRMFNNHLSCQKCDWHRWCMKMLFQVNHMVQLI